MVQGGIFRGRAAMETVKELNLDTFMAAYYAASRERQQSALRTAMAAINGIGPGPARKLLTQRALAAALEIHETTVWRWQFPFVEWAGQKRYDLEACQSYVQSPNLKLRLLELKKERGRAVGKACSTRKRVRLPASD